MDEIQEYAIIIKTGYYDIDRKCLTPRKTFINYSHPNEKYALLHICIRNDYGPDDARTLYVEYINDKDSIINYFDSDEISSKKMNKLMNGMEIWIDEWKKRRNGDLYRLFEIENLTDETIKKMFIRIQTYISGADERGEIDNFSLYQLNDKLNNLPEYIVYPKDNSKSD